MEKGRQVTIREIATHLGVSTATVSTALTGRRNRVFVSEETRDRIVRAAQEMGYQVNRLRTRRSTTLKKIALMCIPYRNPVYHSMVLELSHHFWQQGVEACVQTSEDSLAEYEVAQDLYRRQEVDGVIFIGARSYPDEMLLRDLPCVVIGEVPEGVPAWLVNVDNQDGGRMVAEHLWSLGHRNVGILAGGKGSTHERFQGLRFFWREQGSDFPDERIFAPYPDQSRPFGEALCVFLQSASHRGQPLTALFCYNDWIAGCALKSLQKMGLRVPEDVSVAGFDDAPYAELLTPSLTTVCQPFTELGALAAQLLLERIHNPKQAAKTLLLRGRLIVRDSTGPANPSG